MSMKEIDKIITSYLISSSGDKLFFANLLIQLKKIETTKIPTAGVSIEDGEVLLYYNPNFLNKIIENEGKQKLKGIIEHELLHLVYDHIGRCKQFNYNQQVWNIATDIAINQLIDKTIMPNKIIKPLYPKLFNLPEKKNADWYYDKLKSSSNQGQGKKSKEQSNNESERDNFDDHSKWKTSTGNAKMAREVVKKIVKEAYENTKKMRGYVSSSLEEVISELLKPPTISWRRLLKQYVGASIKTGWKRSWKRPNRRFIFREDIKGKVNLRTLKLAVAIDTSGSMSESEFIEFLNELRGILHAYKHKVKIIQCDANIQSIEDFHPYSKIKFKFKGRGGTSFKPVIKWYNKHPDIELLIYVTDGYGDQEEIKTNKDIIWCLTSNGMNINEFKPNTGRVIKIKKDEK